MTWIRQLRHLPGTTAIAVALIMLAGACAAKLRKKTVGIYLSELHAELESRGPREADLSVLILTLPESAAIRAIESYDPGTNDWVAAETFSSAVARGNLKIVRALLHRGWKVTKDSNGRTALHWAAAAGNTEILAEFCRFNPYGFLEPDSMGWTPLHFAIALGHRELASMLAAWLLQFKDEEVVRAQMPFATFSGKTPLHFSEMLHFSDISDELMKAGCTKDARDGRGWTPHEYFVRAPQDRLEFKSVDVDSTKQIVEFSAEFNKTTGFREVTRPNICLGPQGADFRPEFLSHAGDADPSVYLLQINPKQHFDGLNLPFVQVEKDGTTTFAIYQKNLLEKSVQVRLRDSEQFQKELQELQLSSFANFTEPLGENVLSIQFNTTRKAGLFNLKHSGSICAPASILGSTRVITDPPGAGAPDALEARTSIRLLLLYIQLLPDLIER